MKVSGILNMRLYVVLVLASASLGTMAQTTYLNFYAAPKESYIKSMRQVFEDIHERKWDKAQKDYSKVEEKSNAAKEKHPEYTNTQMQALYPLPQLAMAILLSTENTMVPSLSLDYDKAYSLLKHALTYPEKDKLNAFLMDPDVSVNLSMLEDRVEDELCKKATATNTEQAYDAVIDSLLPQSLRLQSMKTQRENLVFTTISKAPTEKECNRFLEKYADALQMHKRSINNTLDSLRYSALDGSVESLEGYIKKYPASSYASRAKKTLEDLEYKKIDNTAASCRRFMEKYPSSQYTMEVKKKLTELAYNEAIAAGTAEAYQNYCKEFPYDLHYQNVFDTLLTRTITNMYDTVFAGREPDLEKYLSSSFYDSVKKRDAADQSLIEHSLVPPRRRNIWTGLAQDLDTKPFDHLDITNIDLKSKTNASVHIHLTGPTEGAQADMDLDFIFEGTSLKLDDIRLDDGKSSQKQSNLGC